MSSNDEARGTGPDRYPSPYSVQPAADADLYPPCPDCGERTYYGSDNMPRCPDCYDPDEDFDQQEPVGCPVCGEEWDYDCNGNPRCDACDPPCPCCHDGNCGGVRRVVGDDEDPDAVPNDVDADDVGTGACAWCGTHAPLSTFTSGGRHINSPYVTARLRAFCCWSCHQSYHS